MSPWRCPLPSVGGVCEQVCLGSVMSGVGGGRSAWGTLWWGRSESHVPSLSQPTGICPSGAPLPSSAGRKRLLPVPLSSFASISASPYLPAWPACLLTWLCSLVSCWARPLPGPLTRMCPRCSGCSVWHAPPALLPAGPTPPRSCAGGLGGRGILNPQGGGGQGTESPVSCFY